MEKIQTVSARVLSYLMHPLLLPTWGLLLILNLNTYISYILPFKLKLFLIGFIFINTFVLPGLVSAYLVKTRRIDSVEMHNPDERRIPYLVTAFFYVLTYWLLQRFLVSHIIFIFILAAALAIVLTLLINFKWKISAHMVGAGGLTGAILGLSIRLGSDLHMIVAALFLLSGLIGTARLILNAHNYSQVYAGFALGFICEFLLIAFV